MNDQYVFEVQVKGKDFRAELISPREVADFICSVERMINSIVVRDNPALDLSSDDVVLGFSSITLGSLNGEFISNYEEEVKQAVALSAHAMQSNQFGMLPSDAVEAIKVLRKFNRKHSTVTEFWEHNGHHRQVATLTGQTKISVNSVSIKGRATLYGNLIRIGGDDPPRALIHFVNGKRLSCRVKNTHLAAEMAQKLYERIGVRGVATWAIRDMSLLEFRVDELLPYKKTTLGNAIRSLRNDIGQYHSDITDIEGYLADLRGHSETSE